MFQHFSGSYYLGEFTVRPTEGERASIQRTDHERVNEELYAEGRGVERTDAPLVMKLGPCHFPVHGHEDVPEDTLELPPSTLEAADVGQPPSRERVLLAKKDRAWQLLKLAGWEPNAGT